MSLRLVKVLVQPILVWDDGTTLREVQTQPVEVAAADWSGFPATLAEQIASAPDPFAVEANSKTPYGDAVAADYHDVTAVLGEKR